MTDTPRTKHRTVSADQALVPAPEGQRMSPTEIQRYADRLAQASLVQAAEVEADSAEFVSLTTPQAMAEAVGWADYVAPKFIRLKAGQTLRGVLEARGTMTLERTERGTGVVEEVVVAKYTLSTMGGKVRGWILGSHELDSMLELVPADGTHEVIIFRGPQEELDGGKRVNRFQVAAKRIKEAPAPQLVSAS